MYLPFHQTLTQRICENPWGTLTGSHELSWLLPPKNFSPFLPKTPDCHKGHKTYHGQGPGNLNRHHGGPQGKLILMQHWRRNGTVNQLSQSCATFAAKKVRTSWGFDPVLGILKGHVPQQETGRRRRPWDGHRVRKIQNYSKGGADHLWRRLQSLGRLRRLTGGRRLGSLTNGLVKVSAKAFSFLKSFFRIHDNSQ